MKIIRIINYLTKKADWATGKVSHLFAFEVKLTKNPAFNDIKNLLTFIEDYPQTAREILIHAGGPIKWLHSKVLAVPWWWIGS